MNTGGVGVRSLTLAQEIVGEGSPRAEQGMSSSRPTSWKYSSLGRSRKAGGACKPDLALGGGSLTLLPEGRYFPSAGAPVTLCLSPSLSVSLAFSLFPSRGAGGTLLERQSPSGDVQTSAEHPSPCPLLPTLFSLERKADWSKLKGRGRQDILLCGGDRRPNSPAPSLQKPL